MSLFTRRSNVPDPVVYFGPGEPLRYERIPKYLGVIFDRQLSFTAHVDYVYTKGWRALNHLRRVAGDNWGR